MVPVLVVPTGVANTASVFAAFARVGAAAELCGDRERLATAPRVVLPGVGAFGAGMARLSELGLVDVLRTRCAVGRPLLAICLGMQLLCAASEESPGVHGLGVFDATVRRFGGDVRVPQLGWNRVVPVQAGLLEMGAAYFANSYRIEGIPAGCGGGTTDHGGVFASAITRGGLLACQFHPEISGAYGERLLTRWLRSAEVA